MNKHVSKNRAKKSAANSTPKRKKSKKNTKLIKKALTPAQFQALQRKWYKKAAASGFKDLERLNPQDGQPFDMLHGPSLRNAATQYKPETLHYYRQYSCFLMHNTTNLEPRTRRILMLYAEGATYRNIMRAINAEFKQHKIYLDGIHRLIKYFDQRIKQWNKTSSKGLDFEPDI